MIKKQSNFIEEHIEKIVLLLCGVIAGYILFAFMWKGRDDVLFDGKQYRPGEIDIYIAEQAEKLKSRLDREPNLKPPYVSQSVNFLAKINSALDSNLNLVWPMPSAVKTSVDKRYRIPLVGEVNNVEIEYIRAAAYLPKVPVTAANVATEDIYDINDLDLVTVQANFDLAQLIDSFQDCFAGKDVPQSWRDSSLARPVIAGVVLQRQRLGDDGLWGPWQDVPRPRIDPGRDEYQIKEKVSDLPNGGVMVELAKFGSQQIQLRLLQPDAYRIASAEENWLPPLLHRKFLAVKKEKEAQERRDAAVEREAKATEERNTERAATPRPTTSTHPTASQPEGGRGGSAGRGGGMTTGRSTSGRSGGGPDRGGSSISRSPSRTVARPDRSPDRDRRNETETADQKKNAKPAVTEASISEEMRKLQLTRKDLSSLRETVTLWAYDDNVAPGESYQYRLRLGVFNPVAGTGQVKPEDAAKNNDVVLWSDYSQVTEVVDIPKRMYFFPINVQEPAMAAEMQVCKYELGYWHSQQFMVKRGDEIGKVAKLEPTDKDKEAEIKLPDTVDYSTGALVVDVIATNDWFGDKSIQQRQYYDVLFSFDGTNMERLAAKQMFWPDDLRQKYAELKALEKKPKSPWRAWSATGLENTQRANPMDRRGMPDRNTQQQQMDDYMRMRMGAPRQE